LENPVFVIVKQGVGEERDYNNTISYRLLKQQKRKRASRFLW